MANQYTQFNRANVLVKLYRQRNPVRSVSQMAREFNMPRTSVRRQLLTMLSTAEFSLLTKETRKFSYA